MKAFTSACKIRFSNTDAAGITFFANVFTMAHDAYEDFVASLGFSWPEWFDNKNWGVPIRQSSCEYFRPLLPGKDCQIEVTIEKIGETSLGLHYRFLIDEILCCEVRLTHAFVELKPVSGKLGKTPIPSKVRQRLEAYRAQCLAAE